MERSDWSISFSIVQGRWKIHPLPDTIYVYKIVSVDTVDVINKGIEELST